MTDSGADDGYVSISFIIPDGSTRRISAANGETLMEAAVRHGIDGILATCGGSCTCATCHVVLCNDWIDRVGRASDMEIGTLYFARERHDASRLACQLIIGPHLDGLVVRVVPPR